MRKPKCSFCGKGQEEVKQLIAGPRAYICNECVDAAYKQLAETKNPHIGSSFDSFLEEEGLEIVIARKGG